MHFRFTLPWILTDEKSRQTWRLWHAADRQRGGVLSFRLEKEPQIALVIKIGFPVSHVLIWCSQRNPRSAMWKNPPVAPVNSRLAHSNTTRKLTALWELRGTSRCVQHTPIYSMHRNDMAPGAYLLLRSPLLQVSFVVAGRELRPGSPRPGALPYGSSRHECRWLGDERGQRGAE